MPARPKDDARAIATNRRARHDYHVEETFEAGIALVGSEVKTLREGKASLQDSYAQVREGEVLLYNVHIPEYKQASMLNHEPTRTRKLLLHRREIRRLWVATAQQGYTIVPLRLYFKENKIKVEIALARGRKRYDKREAIAKRDAEREMQRRRADATRRGRRR